MTKQLVTELRDLAKKQFGPLVTFCELEIINWPDNVRLPTHCSHWSIEDMKAINEVKETFTFKYQRNTKSKSYQNQKSKKDLKARFVRKSNELIGETCYECIKFSEIHIHGWPVGVGIRPDKWNLKEVQILEDSFDQIVFTMKQRKEEKTVVTDVNGNVLNFDSNMFGINCNLYIFSYLNLLKLKECCCRCHK